MFRRCVNLVGTSPAMTRWVSVKGRWFESKIHVSGDAACDDQALHPAAVHNPKLAGAHSAVVGSQPQHKSGYIWWRQLGLQALIEQQLRLSLWSQPEIDLPLG